jgi:hypothetical protein
VEGKKFVVLIQELKLQETKVKCTRLLACMKCVCDPYKCFGKQVAIFMGLFSRELQDVYSFAQTYVGVGNTFHPC